MEDVRVHNWISVKSSPKWNEVEASMAKLRALDLLNADDRKIHEQFGQIATYCSTAKIAEWRSNSTSTADRWVEVFTHLDEQDQEYSGFLAVVEYILCLSATTASVERTFSAIHKSWTSDKTQMGIETLKAMTMVKCNMEFACNQFYDYIKDKPELLRKITGSAKYKSTTNTGNEQIDDSDEE